MRKSQLIGVLIACAVACVGSARAEFPSRDVKLVALNPPGGVSDTLARILAERLTVRWSQPVVVENRVGAAGMIGSELVAAAPPDGHTLLIGFVGNLSINPALYKRLRYDPAKDFAPISLIGRSPLVLLSQPTFPAKSVAEVIALAKTQPGSMAYASAGIGNGAHLAMEVFQSMAGIKLLHVPYRGGPQASMAVASGDVQLTLATVPSAITLIKTGKVRAIAVTSAQRLPPIPELPALSEIPTVSESGLPGFEVTTWFGLVAPAAIPALTLRKLTADVADALQEEDVRKKIMAAGLIPESSTPQAFRQLIESETRRWREVIESNNVTPN